MPANPATPTDGARSALRADAERLRFTITGRIIPYVRMTQRGKYVKPEAQRYLASKDAIGLQLRQQMAANGWEMLPRVPLAVRIEIESTDGLHRSDLDNEVKAILDAAQGVVYPNDCWVDRLEAERRKGSRAVATLELALAKCDSGMPKGYTFKRIRCERCGQEVAENWLLQHWRSGCLKGGHPAPGAGEQRRDR